MSQVIKIESNQFNLFDISYSQNSHQLNQNYPNKTSRKNSIEECTCEMGKLKAMGKKTLHYSMCDVCSEKLFSEGKIN